MKPCALCGTPGLEPLFCLTELPLSHHLRKSASDPDPRFDLTFAHCPNCGLLQIANPIEASTIYGGGADTYVTGFQRPRHLDDLIATAIARQAPGSVLDVGCNDGALLDRLKEHGHGLTVGIEPNVAAARRVRGHAVYGGYLDDTMAATVRQHCGQFDAVYARHVIEHVPDIGAFMRAVRHVLRDGGQLVVELPEVDEALRAGSPAILWEEHVSYLTQAQAEFMLTWFGFRILDRRHYGFGGGSIAFVAEKVPAPAQPGVISPDPKGAAELRSAFINRMRLHKGALRDLVIAARDRGWRVMMYGAAPRSVMVAAVAGIGDLIDVVVDDRADLWNRLMPGTDCTITHLGAARLGVGPQTLCLLGVGAESEHRVIPRLLGGTVDPVFVSLFPPRDVLASIQAARREIDAEPARAAA